MEHLKVQPLSGAKSPVKGPTSPPPPPLTARVRVAVRVRPSAITDGDEPPPLCIPEADPETGTNVGANTLYFQHEKTQKAFRFDHVFSAEAQQSDVYNASLQPLLASLLHGFNVTVLAYGQTGSGKTHTMGGAEKSTLEAGNNDGLISRFLRDLFEAVRNEASMKMMINVSFLEVYCDEIRDLLIDGEQARSNSQNDIRPRSAARLTIREDDQDVWVEGLRKVNVKSVDEALNLLETGRQRQAIGAHALNYHSSRSHAVYTLDISRVLPNEIKGAKLTFVDLAGSERLKKTLMEGQDMKEGSHINIGLLALGNVINALGSKQRILQRRNSTGASGRRNSISGSDTFDPRVSAHVPYRSSKLTRLLRDALGGNSVTLFIACISPEATNSNETLCTLQYANRARSIQNTARNNVEEADTADIMDELTGIQHSMESEREINHLREQVAALKLQLDQLSTAAKESEARYPSHAEAVQHGIQFSGAGQTNHAASKARRSSKSKRRLRIAPPGLDMSDLAITSHRIESEQLEGIVNRNTQQHQQDSFFMGSPAAKTTDQSTPEEDKPRQHLTIPASLELVSVPPYAENDECNDTCATQLASKQIPSSRNKGVVNATQTGNQSHQTPGKSLRAMTSQGTQYESPLCLQSERKTPVDYVLLSPSQIFREIHHQRQAALAGAPSPWPHQRRLDTPHKEPKYSPPALLSLDIGHDTPSQKSATFSKTPDALLDLLQRTRQLVEDTPELWHLDSRPEVHEPEQKQEQQSLLSFDAFLEHMMSLYDQRRRQHQFVHRLRQRFRYLKSLLGAGHLDLQMIELSKYSLENQQDTLQQQLQACELLAAERLWIRLQHREDAIENYAGLWNENLEGVFLTDDQYEACTPWHAHRDDHEFFQRHILPFILNGWISVTPGDLDNEQLWLIL